MTGQDWSKSRVAACHMTGTSMLVIKGPASTILPQLIKFCSKDSTAVITKKCWHPTAIISQILQQKFYGKDQIKGWHSTAIISQILQQSSTAETNPRAGILLP